MLINADQSVAGLVVLYLSIFSLAFQFSDFGNSPYGIKCIGSGGEKRFDRFRFGRAIFALPYVGFVTWFCLRNIESSEVYTLIVMVPIGAFVFGVSNTISSEFGRDYIRLASVQVFPWLATSLILYFVFGFPSIFNENAVIVWMFVPVFFLFVLAKNKAGVFKGMLGIRFREFFPPLYFLLPNLVGQFWGRWMLIIIADVATLAALAPLGLMRSIHTAISLFFGFVNRPKIQEVFSSFPRCEEGRQLELFKKLTLHQFKYFIVIYIFCVACLSDISPLSKDLKHWLPVVFGLPFWVVSSNISVVFQSFYGARLFSALEVVSMFVHILAFVVTVNYSPVFSFVFADLFRFVFMCIVFFLLARKNKANDRV